MMQKKNAGWFLVEGAISTEVQWSQSVDVMLRKQNR